VKQYIKAAGTAFLLITLALGAGLHDGHRLGQCAVAVLQPNHQAGHSALDTQPLFLPAGSELARGTFSAYKLAGGSGKDFPKGISGILRQAKELIHIILTQYQKEASTFPVRLRKADLIFPFHYFR